MICCSYCDYDYDHKLDLFFFFSLFHLKPIAYIRSGNFPNPQNLDDHGNHMVSIPFNLFGSKRVLVYSVKLT